MKRTLACSLIACIAFATSAGAAPGVGEPAPDFTAGDSYGETHRLSDYEGRIVVLEWTNHDCPYVRKHYETGNMQALQEAATAGGVAWFSIVSSRPGSQGHVTPEEANALTESRDAAPTAVLLDPEGIVGRLYDARVTPHMYVIDETGRLVYAGGIDDKPTSRRSSVEGAHNYVQAALTAVQAGEPVATPTARPYGCTVKY